MSVAVEAPMPGSRSVPASAHSSSATFGPWVDPAEASEKRNLPEQSNGHSTNIPTVNVNRSSLRTPRSPKVPQANGQDGDDAAWGSNFWVTLVDPQASKHIWLVVTLKVADDIG